MPNGRDFSLNSLFGLEDAVLAFMKLSWSHPTVMSHHWAICEVPKPCMTVSCSQLVNKLLTLCPYPHL